MAVQKNNDAEFDAKEAIRNSTGLLFDPIVIAQEWLRGYYQMTSWWLSMMGMHKY